MRPFNSLIVAGLLLCAMSAAQAQQSSDLERVQAASRQFVAAIVARDINTMDAVWAHESYGNITLETLKLYGLGLPFMMAGIWVGFELYGKIDDETFRKVVLVLLLFAGASLIVSASIPRDASVT
jgi:uncharacterized membrane protein YfcA